MLVQRIVLLAYACFCRFRQSGFGAKLQRIFNQITSGEFKTMKRGRFETIIFIYKNM